MNTPWQTVENPPEIGQLVLVLAYEFGCAPEYYICRYWCSSLPNQPGEYYLHDTYCTPVRVDIGLWVRFWMAIPEPEEVRTDETR